MYLLVAFFRHIVVVVGLCVSCAFHCQGCLVLVLFSCFVSVLLCIHITHYTRLYVSVVRGDEVLEGCVAWGIDIRWTHGLLFPFPPILACVAERRLLWLTLSLLWLAAGGTSDFAFQFEEFRECHFHLAGAGHCQECGQ